MIRVRTIRLSMFSLGVLAASLIPHAGAHANEAYSSLVQSHAAAHGLPPSLVHRVIMRESRYNPRAVSKGNYGMMQIRLGTARAMGYTGSAAGLLDANTNMTYAVKYLAGAYRAAGGNQDRAVALYASGYGGGGVGHAVSRVRTWRLRLTVGAIGARYAGAVARGAPCPRRIPSDAAPGRVGVTTSRELEVR